tara:strand:+ start:790 stop:963 length:174 start_codon:yes stop_codon:yes gene_type:complete
MSKDEAIRRIWRDNAFAMGLIPLREYYPYGFTEEQLKRDDEYVKEVWERKAELKRMR